MKILRKMVDKNRKGFITLKPESEEDLWYLYNIIKIGDYIKLKIKRKIQEQTLTGLTKTNKRYILAKLEILMVDFDYDSRGTTLFCKTRNIFGTEHLESGQLQTVEVCLLYPITIYKSYWDEIALSFIDESVQTNEKSDVGVLLIEDGKANAYYMKSNYSLWQGKIEKTLPRKKSTLIEFYKKAFNSFQERCLTFVESIFDLDVIKCFIIAGPGTSPKNFYNFLQSCKDKAEYSKLKKNMSKFITVAASSAQKTALTEIMEDPTVMKLISDTRAIKETQILKQFLETIRNDSNKAVYGEKEVFMAHDAKAIDHLLITDGLFRSRDFRARRRYIKLVDDAKAQGVTVHIFSDLHPSGQKLKEITGIAGILKFEMDTNLLEDCHKNDDAISELTEEQHESEEQQHDDFQDDDQFDTYLMPEDSMAGDGEDI